MEVLSSRILLRPADLDRSRRFYRDVIGLAVYREFGPPDDPGVVFFLGQGFLEVSGRSDDTRGRALEIWLQVRDVHAEHDRLGLRGPGDAGAAERTVGARRDVDRGSGRCAHRRRRDPRRPPPEARPEVIIGAVWRTAPMITPATVRLSCSPAVPGNWARRRVSTTSRCTTTVGSTIQIFSTWTPGVPIVCVVVVTLTLSEVFRSHCLFMVLSLAPVVA